MDAKLIEKEIGGYKHVISLGSFCSPALKIERLGLRDGSYPFDWVLSRSMNNVVELITLHKLISAKPISLCKELTQD